ARSESHPPGTAAPAPAATARCSCPHPAVPPGIDGRGAEDRRRGEDVQTIPTRYGARYATPVDPDRRGRHRARGVAIDGIRPAPGGGRVRQVGAGGYLARERLPLAAALPGRCRPAARPARHAAVLAAGRGGRRAVLRRQLRRRAVRRQGRVQAAEPAGRLAEPSPGAPVHPGGNGTTLVLGSLLLVGVASLTRWRRWPTAAAAEAPGEVTLEGEQ